VASSSLSGRYEPVLDAWRMRGVRAELRGSGGWVSGGTNSVHGLWSLSAALGAYARDAVYLPLLGRPIVEGSNAADIPSSRPIVGRVFGALSLEQRARGERTLVSQTLLGVSGGRALPPQWLLFAGGPLSAPGYNYASFATRAYVSQRLELRQPMPAPAIPLGHWGKAPAHVTLAPFVQAIAVADGLPNITLDGTPTVAGVYPSAGLGVLFFFDLVRIDVARGLRNGQWRFALDIDRGFWGIL
jgi:hypothetical protein